MDETKNLQKYLDDDHYSRLYNFYKKSWEGDYKYHVYITANTKNLNELFYNTFINDDKVPLEEKERIKVLRENTFINNIGMRFKAKELADYYVQNNKIPKILVVCNETLDGIELAQFFFEMYFLILNEIGKIKDIDNDVLSMHIRCALNDAISCVIYYHKSNFATTEYNDIGLKLDNLTGTVTNIGCREKSLEFIEICHFGITNGLSKSKSNYAPIFSISSDDYKIIKNNLSDSSIWNEKIFNYNRMYTLNNHLADEKKLFRILNCKSDSETMYISSYIFTGEITNELLQALNYKLTEFFKVNNLPQLVSILKNDFFADLNGINLIQSAKLELVYFLLSSLSIINFLIDGGLIDKYKDDFLEYSNSNQIFKRSIERICQNFGTINDIFSNVNSFFQMVITDRKKLDEFDKIISDVFNRSSSLKQFDNSAEENIYTNDLCLYVARNYFIDENQTVLKEAKEWTRIKNVYHGKYKYYYESGLTNYLSSFKKSFSLKNKLYALIILIEDGYVEQSIAIQHGNADYFKVNLDTYLLEIKKINRFYLLLFAYERLCFNYGLTPTIHTQGLARIITELYEEYADDYDSLTEIFKSYSNLIPGVFRWDDWEDILYNSDKPDLDNNTPYRTIKEWNGKPWSKSEMEEIVSLTSKEYREMEIEKRRNLVNNFNDFLKRSLAEDENARLGAEVLPIDADDKTYDNVYVKTLRKKR